ncbi:MAG: molybdenum cofactor biosynthesis protein MoaC [miscellaneous Crenarchaeota group-6 archaeon AD8-1]|nr:MAG: molybdenum cofactor biosynthesis protein MoaC [miscellaneous Crenarchaeota group-6 archaeon AD8-1]
MFGNKLLFNKKEAKKMTMIDISKKRCVIREATAKGNIILKSNTVKLIKNKQIIKGDPIYAAKIAAILAAKKTSEIIPLCHPLPLENIIIEISIATENSIQVSSTVKTTAQTGVEMEALTATSIGLLTIWDMVKQYEKNIEGQYPNTKIEKIIVVRKYKQA